MGGENNKREKKVDGLFKRIFHDKKAAQKKIKAISEPPPHINTTQFETELTRLGLKSLIREKRLNHYKALHGISPKDLQADHLRLLYLISCYANPHSKHWMRTQSISVLVHEGILDGVFDYDYAPRSEDVEGNLLFINVSQEGEDDLADLRECGMLQVLLLSTYQHKITETCQVTADGYQILQKWRHSDPAAYAKDTRLVNKLIFKTKAGDLPEDLPLSPGSKWGKYLVMVSWDQDGESFLLHSKDGYSNFSRIMEIEDVTYVCSPFVPDCLQNGTAVGEMPKSNHGIAVKVVDALRKERLAKGNKSNAAARSSNIKDTLQEILKLGKVKVVIAEWIPFGRNHMSNLIKKLGAERRIQGGMLTTHVDRTPGLTVFDFDLRKAGNCVHVLDYKSSAHINFLADIMTPEAEGIMQVEEFGVHVHFDGSVLYGLEVESIEEQLTDNLSMDKLARLLVDVQQDSSFLTFSLTTAYQRVLMDTMSAGCSFNREKFNLVLAESITPRLPADAYMDGEENQMEIQQIIGHVKAAYDLANGQILMVIGHNGMLLVGKSAHVYEYEATIVAYLCLRSRELCMDRFINHLFHLGDNLQELRHCVVTYTEDPGSLDKMTLLQSETLHEVINMEELLSQIIEGLTIEHSVLSELKVPGISSPSRSTSRTGTVQPNPVAVLPAIQSPRVGGSWLHEKAKGLSSKSSNVLPSKSGEWTMVGAEIAEVLDVAQLYKSLRLRCNDMATQLQGARAELDSLRHMTSYIGAQEAYKLQNQVQSNTRNLEQVFRANERASSSLEIMQVIMAGSLAFDILDRCAILYMSIPHGPHYQLMIQIVRIPMVWFLINVTFWLLMSYVLVKFKQYLKQKADGIFTVRLNLNIPINVAGISKMLMIKEVVMEDMLVEENGFLRSCTYVDRSKVWRDFEVKVDLVYDEKSAHLLKAFLQVPKACGFNNVGEVEDAFFRDLMLHKAISRKIVNDWKAAAMDTQKEVERKVQRQKDLIASYTLRGRGNDGHWPPGAGPPKPPSPTQGRGRGAGLRAHKTRFFNQQVGVEEAALSLQSLGVPASRDNSADFGSLHEAVVPPRPDRANRIRPGSITPTAPA